MPNAKIFVKKWQEVLVEQKNITTFAAANKEQVAIR
jgi:hypothetical protein